MLQLVYNACAALPFPCAPMALLNCRKLLACQTQLLCLLNFRSVRGTQVLRDALLWLRWRRHLQSREAVDQLLSVLDNNEDPSQEPVLQGAMLRSCS